MIHRRWNHSRAIEIPRGRGSADPAPRSGGILRVALLGRVAAGLPIEAVAHVETIEVPREFARGRDTFALRVQGESMINEQIRDGDLILVERRETARNGETVVALIHGRETTVKKFYRVGPRTVRLLPANENMAPITLPAEACRIQGVVIGLMRKY